MNPLYTNAGIYCEVINYVLNRTSENKRLVCKHFNPALVQKEMTMWAGIMKVLYS